MNCVECTSDDFIIKCIRGATKEFTVIIDSAEFFDGFTAVFAVRKDLRTPILLSKEFSVLDNAISIKLDTEDTNKLPAENEQAIYIWGIDIYNSENRRISVIPEVGNNPPYFLLYKNVTMEG